jgi:phage repressor protein C with HTH and peptisase S24 domain
MAKLDEAAIFRERVNQRISELGISHEAASRAAGKDKTYLRKTLARDGAIPKLDTLESLAVALEVSSDWLLGRTEALEPRIGRGAPLPSDVRLADIPAPSRNGMPADIPVMGTAAGSLSSGAFQFEGGVIDYVRRPPALSGARDIYALYVEGSSMEPRYFPGELVYVNPHKPPRIGDTVIVQEGSGETSSIAASIGVLHKRANGTVILRKYNPAGAEITIQQNCISAIHRVLTPNELFGV